MSRPVLAPGAHRRCSAPACVPLRSRFRPWNRRRRDGNGAFGIEECSRPTLRQGGGGGGGGSERTTKPAPRRESSSMLTNGSPTAMQAPVDTAAAFRRVNERTQAAVLPSERVCTAAEAIDVRSCNGEYARAEPRAPSRFPSKSERAKAGGDCSAGGYDRRSRSALRTAWERRSLQAADANQSSTWTTTPPPPARSTSRGRPRTKNDARASSASRSPQQRAILEKTQFGERPVG